MNDKIAIYRGERTIEDWDWTGTVYICGPISNLDNSNLDSFTLVDHVLKKHKHKPVVLNPMTIDQGLNYGALIGQSMTMLTKASKVIVLPKWELSKGATNEVYTACLMGLIIRFVHPAYLTRLMVFTATQDYLNNPL
jgi:hypothetical protein